MGNPRARICRWYNSLSLSMRTLLLAFCFVALPTLLLGIGSHITAARILRSQALRQSVQENRERAMLLDNALRDAVLNFNRLLGDRRFERTIRASASGQTPAPDSGDVEYVEALVSNFRRAHGLISSAAIYTESTVFYERSRHIHVAALDATDDDYFRDYQALLGEMSVAWGVRLYEYRQGTVLATPSLGILLAPYVSDLPPRRAIAALTVNERVLQQYLAEEHIRNNSRDDVRAYVLNDRNEVIARAGGGIRHGSDATSDLSGIPTDRRSGYISSGRGSDAHVGVYATVSVNGWKLLTLIPANTFAQRTRFISYLTFAFVALGATLAAVFSVLVSRGVTKPLRALHSVVDSVRAGDLHVRFAGSNSDEVSEFGHTMNRMLDETERLIRALEQEKKRVVSEHNLKCAAELKALQAQVNPHFLYNTLNAVYWKSMVAGNRDVAELSMALSRFFRLGLSKGAEQVSVANEIDLVRTYLDIQRTVYKDSFEYSVEIAPEIGSLYVPKFTLQPLVENSILHGFRERSGPGRIRIEGFLLDGQMCLSVEDNGAGFDAAALESRLESTAEWTVEDHEPEGGYALENVYRRLKLFFGDEARMEFSSTQYERNRVTIVTPLVVDATSKVATRRG